MKSQRIPFLLIFFLFSLCMCISYQSNQLSYELLFIMNSIEVCIIIYFCKFSILSLLSIFVYYPSISLRHQYLTGQSYGLLQSTTNSGMRLNYGEIQFSIFLFLSTLLILINLTNFLEIERGIQYCKLNLTDNTEIVLCIFAIFAMFIAFPTLPFIYNSVNRFSSLLPGNAWNHLTISTLCILVLNKNKRFISYFTIVLVSFWFLSHFERVDIIGFILGVILLTYVNSKIKISIKKFILGITVVFVVLLLMVFVGEKRAGVSEISFGYLVSKLFVQNTSADLMYVFNVGILTTQMSGFFHGSTLVHFFYDAIPLFEAENINSIIRQHYYTPGGEHLLLEPYMNFGKVGIVLFTVFLFVLFYTLIKKKTKMRYIYYFFFLSTIPRISWYGISYIETASIFFIPFLIFMINIGGASKFMRDTSNE